MMTRPLALIACLVLPLTVAPAQEIGRLAEPQEPSPTILGRTFGGVFFERNLNTFNWLGKAVIDTSLGAFSLKMDEQYASNIILIDATSTSPERRPQSNQQSITFLPGWRLSPSAVVMARWNSLVYSDNKAVGLSTASFHTLHGGISYTPLEQFLVNPLIGYRWDNQGAFDNHGMSYDVGAGTNPFMDVAGYRLFGNLRFNQDHIDPRLLENHLARVGLQRAFTGATRDSLEIQFTRSRREFYNLAGTTTAPVDTNLESRVDDVLSFANLLDYEIDRSVIATFFIGISNRMLDKDIRYLGSGTQVNPQFGTTIEEFRLNSYVRARYASEDGRSFAEARFQFDERNETHAAKPLPGAPEALFRVVNDNEKTKDNLSRRTTFTGGLRFPFSRSDMIGISGTASILRYDTPHARNVEDRDEQLLTIGITTSHALSHNLDLGITLSGSESHIVYLLGDRSANNNINRVLRLVPRVTYRPFSGASSMNSFEVLANYTVYDFEEQAALIRSFSYRQFAWQDSTTIPLASRLSLDFVTFLKLYERGQLKWSEFTERTETSFADETYAVQLRFEHSPGVMFAAGLRYFGQTRYTYSDGVRVFNSRLKSFGPTCAINWQVNAYGLLSLAGWYEERRQSDGFKRTLPNVTLNIQVKL